MPPLATLQIIASVVIETKRIHRHAHLSLRFSPTSNALLDCFEYIGRIVARTAFPTNACRHILNQYVAISDLTVETNSPLNDWSSTILTRFVFPKTHLQFPFYLKGLSSYAVMTRTFPAKVMRHTTPMCLVIRGHHTTFSVFRPSSLL